MNPGNKPINGLMNSLNRVKMDKIFIASDHGGVEFKKELSKYLDNNFKAEIVDLGSHKKNSVDYSDYANKLTERMMEYKNSKGVLICKSGIGMSIAANKVNGIRAAVGYNPKIAELSRRHNNANVICFGADFIPVNEAKASLNKFLTTEFEGGRHKRRLSKIKDGN